jgi:hypothetical protein
MGNRDSLARKAERTSRRKAARFVGMLVAAEFTQQRKIGLSPIRALRRSLRLATIAVIFIRSCDIAGNRFQVPSSAGI